MKKLIFIGVFLSAAPAFAQQQQSPAEQALGTKLLQEIQSGLNCSADLISTRTELAKAQARIKELEAKPEAPAKAK